MPANPIHPLPPPPQLALPLPPHAIPRVKTGDHIPAGAPLATRRQHAADLRASLAGRITGIAWRTRASDGTPHPCILITPDPDPPPTPTQPTPHPHSPTDLPHLLQSAGITGLGGGAYPAHAKWRQNLRHFIANGLETDPEAHHDAAQIAAAGADLPAQINTVAKAFAATPYLALPPATAARHRHPIVRAVPTDYAIGNERLLIARLCGIGYPPTAIAADYGVICYNIATVLAMAAAITHGTPLTHRAVTAYAPNGTAHILSIPFGCTIADIRRHIQKLAPPPPPPHLPPPALVGGADERRRAQEDDILTAAATIIRFDAPPNPPPHPCIQCGACDPVCPAALSPRRLHQLAQDDATEAMVKNDLMHCLSCRRCDAACPSAIPLTAQFIHHKKKHRTQTATTRRTNEHRLRHDAHQKRLSTPPTRITPGALKSLLKTLDPPPPPPQIPHSPDPTPPPPPSAS